jgi:hypothetical protein
MVNASERAGFHKGIFSTFSATFHKELPSSTAFAQTGRDFLLMDNTE